MALACALLIAVRLLAPAGFMPGFDHGRLVIASCPDEANSAPSHHQHQRKESGTHAPCPYASAAALGGLDIIGSVVGLALLAAAVFRCWPPAGLVVRNARRNRPPARAPPIPA